MLLADAESLRDKADPFLPFDGMLAFLQDSQNLIDTPNSSLDRAPFRCFQAVFKGEIQQTRCLLFETGKRLWPFFPNISIGIISRRQRDDLDPESAVHEQVQATQRGADT